MWLLLLGLAANIFSSQAFRLGFPVGPDRLLIGGAVVLFLLDPRRPRIVLDTVAVMMAAFTSWVLASMVWQGTLADPVSLYAALDRVMVPFLLFAVGAPMFGTPRRRDALLQTLTIVGGLLAVCAVLETWAPGLVRPSFIVDSSIGLGFGRARGPFLSPEGMGAALAVCGVAAFAFSVRSARWRGVAQVTGYMCILGVALSMTRAIWIAALAGLVVAVLISPATRRPIRNGVMACVGVGLLLSWLLPDLRERFVARGGQADSVYDRLGSNDAALRILDQMPLTGIGWRQFFPRSTDWVRQSDAYPINNVAIEVHNVVLSRAAELGVPAAIVFCSIIVLGPLSVLRCRAVPQELEVWRAVAVVSMTVWLVAGLFGPMATSFPTYVPWLLAGVAMACRGAQSSADAPDVRALRKRSEGKASVSLESGGR